MPRRSATIHVGSMTAAAATSLATGRAVRNNGARAALYTTSRTLINTAAAAAAHAVAPVSSACSKARCALPP